MFDPIRAGLHSLAVFTAQRVVVLDKMIVRNHATIVTELRHKDNSYSEESTRE